MNTFPLSVVASLLANLHASAFPVREQGLRRPPRSYKKNRSLMETAV